jgi:hypothetical protein
MDTTGYQLPKGDGPEWRALRIVKAPAQAKYSHNPKNRQLKSPVLRSAYQIHGVIEYVYTLFLACYFPISPAFRNPIVHPSQGDRVATILAKAVELRQFFHHELNALHSIHAGRQQTALCRH